MSGGATIEEQWARIRELERLEEECLQGTDTSPGTGTSHHMSDLF